MLRSCTTIIRSCLFSSSDRTTCRGPRRDNNSTTSIIADGRRRPIVDLNGRPIPGVPPGALAFGTRPNPQTIEAGAEVDGKVLGRGTYRVSDDGQKLTATTEGMGLKGPFKTVAVFEHVVPDPYAPQG
jgi:hypothetical protein